MDGKIKQIFSNMDYGKVAENVTLAEVRFFTYIFTRSNLNFCEKTSFLLELLVTTAGDRYMLPAFVFSRATL